MRYRYLFIVFGVLGMALGTIAANAQQLDYKPKILLVTAHPDDDALYLATVLRSRICSIAF
ncbi:MAG: hypothetical protein U5J63_09730 [Fodinibius sp.]|nr:hypothetical protein [Fodinibius sp.]